MLKDPARETVIFRLRAWVAGGMFSVMLLLLLARMVQLQVVEHAHFRTLSESNRVKIVPLEPTRGLIYDRNGTVLAQNTPTYSLEVVPDAVGNIDELLHELSEYVSVSPLDAERFKREVKRRHRFDRVPLRFRLTDQEVARFAVVRHRYPGVDVHARLSRDYPLGSLAAHVVGYMGRITFKDVN